MTDQSKAKVTSEVVRVRSHFLVKLTEYQWALAKHGIAAGEAEDEETVRIHLTAAGMDLDYISECGALLGFSKLAEHAGRIRHMINLFIERCMGTSNATKLLTDVIHELCDFIAESRKLTERPTVLQVIDIPSLSARIEEEFDLRQA